MFYTPGFFPGFLAVGLDIGVIRLRSACCQEIMSEEMNSSIVLRAMEVKREHNCTWLQIHTNTVNMKCILRHRAEQKQIRIILIHQGSLLQAMSHQIITSLPSLDRKAFLFTDFVTPEI